jgi:hypothetical protein
MQILGRVNDLAFVIAPLPPQKECGGRGDTARSVQRRPVRGERPRRSRLLFLPRIFRPPFLGGIWSGW